jgi:hypothetical protein
MYDDVEWSDERVVVINLSYYSNIVLENLGKCRQPNSDSWALHSLQPEIQFMEFTTEFLMLD